MPDGLELFPLDGGKLELMQEILEAGAADDLSDSALGNCMIYLYASSYDDVRDLDTDELTEAGNELVRSITVEDKQAAEEIILADFDALQASIVRSPKVEARTREERNLLNAPPSSGQDSALDTAEKNLTGSQQLKSCKLPSPKHLPTGTRENHSSGQTQTAQKSSQPASVLSVSDPLPG